MKQWKLARLLMLTFCLLGFLAGKNAFAVSCEVLQSAYSFSVGDIIVQRDAQVGQSVSNEIAGGASNIYRCTTAGGEGTLAGVKSALVYNSTAYNGLRLYKTSIPGIGIAIGGNPHTCGPGYIGQATSFSTAADDWRSLCKWSSNPGQVFTWNLNPIVQLYKTGASGSGSLSGRIASFIAGDGSSGNWQPEVPISISGTVTTVACAITTTNIQVPLDDVLASSLTGAGTTAKPKNFNLGLNCDAGARINVTLAGQQHSDTSATGVLQLSNPLSASTATGVGIQMLYNNSPMPLNTNLVLKTSSGGVETFPFSAQYYQTRSSVTTGTANATATLNITYQ